MPELVEKFYTGEFLRSEANGALSRDSQILDPGFRLEPGTVLAKLDSTGHFVPFDPAGSDGAERAVAILYHRADSTEEEISIVTIERVAEVDDQRLVWPDAITATQKADAIEELRLNYLIVR